MAKRKQTEYIQGHATHRRTEGDYMGVLLDAVTLDDWRGNRSAETWQVESASTASVSPVLPVPVQPSVKSGGTANDSNAYARASRGD